MVMTFLIANFNNVQWCLLIGDLFFNKFQIGYRRALSIQTESFSKAQFDGIKKKDNLYSFSPSFSPLQGYDISFLINPHKDHYNGAFLWFIFKFWWN